MKHLTHEEQRAIAAELEAMRRQVLDELLQSAPGSTGREAQTEVHSHADLAEAERDDEVRLAGIEVDRQRLQDIEQAQQRLADGRYGICVACGDEIPRSRLLAQPTAIRCAACQQALESRIR